MRRSRTGSRRARARKPVRRPAARKAARRRAPAPNRARKAVSKRAPEAAGKPARRRVPGAGRARGAGPRPSAAPGPRQPLVREAEGELQRSDPVEAAQEDLRALPERPLFDRDVAGRDDDLAEMLGEEYVRSVTSGEEQGVELRDQPVPEDEGGPFVESSGQKEFGHDEDDSELEPLPTTRAPQTRKLR
jgi:hypothetical protein